jgi:hypothetical protein
VLAGVAARDLLGQRNYTELAAEEPAVFLEPGPTARQVVLAQLIADPVERDDDHLRTEKALQ